MSLFGRIVELQSIPLHPHALALRAEAVARRGSEEAHERSFSINDWQRLSYVFSRLQPGDSGLEVGPGRCFLTEMMVQAGTYATLSAIDIMDRRVPASVDFRQMSVAKLDFPDRSFDTVICMEVLEHLEDADFHAGLAEIRRVCRQQLIVSVPYLEPLPLPHYHKQHFDEARIAKLFPEATVSLLLKAPITRVPWLLIEEHRPA